jgi:hypothetical protein
LQKIVGELLNGEDPRSVSYYFGASSTNKELNGDTSEGTIGFII